jgi:hypothetical protein
MDIWTMPSAPGTTVDNAPALPTAAPFDHMPTAGSDSSDFRKAENRRS